MSLIVGKKAAIEFNPLLLGLGLTFSAFQGAAHYFLSITDEYVFESYFLFVACALTSLLLGCVVTCAITVNLLRHRKRAGKTKSVRLVFGAALAGVLLGASSLFGLAHENSPQLFLVVGGVFFGVGVLMIGLGWGKVYAGLMPQTVLFHSSLSVLVFATLYFLEALIPAPTLVLLFIMLEFVIGSFLLVRLVGCEEPGVALNEPAVGFRQLAGIAAHTLWAPLLGAMISAFIFGLVWDPIASDIVSLRTSSWYDWSLLLGPLFAAALVLGLLLHEPKVFTQHVFVQVFLPIAVALLLALPMVSFENIGLIIFVGILEQGGFAVILLAIWTSLSVAVRTIGLPSRIIFSICFALCVFAMLLGMLIIPFIGTGGKALCLVLLTVYLVLIVLSFVRKELLQKESRAFEQSVFEKYLQNCCDVLSNAHGLSPREQEVLMYLSRGYSHGYIAKELYVSESTVHTHARHIYSKLHISSREELFKLIDSAQ